MKDDQSADISDDFIEAAMAAAANGVASIPIPETISAPTTSKNKPAEPETATKVMDTASATENEGSNAEYEEHGEGEEEDPGDESDLYGEVGDLAKYLSGVCSKIKTAESFMDDASADIPMGSDQLSEVTRKQEEATQEILDDTDKIIENDDQMEARLNSLKMRLFSENLNARDEIREDVMALCRLVEANKQVMFSMTAKFSFQDSTGQQITKVATMMNTLQSRLLKMVVTFGKKSTRKQAKKVSIDRGDQLLEKLNTEDKMEQGLVDSVLAEFGF